MELRNVNSPREVYRHANREDYIQRSMFVYVNDDTDSEDAELSAEDYDDAPLEADEESEDYDDNGEHSDSAGTGSIQPVWLLYEGQILWSASRYGFRLSPKEYFRRRLQILLDFLAKEFPGKSYGDLLSALQGFFVKDNSSSKGNWLDSLKNVGIIYMDGETRKYEVMPIGNFRAGKGEGRYNEDISRSLPENLERLWLERELSKRIPASGNQLDWKNCKGWLLKELKDFCAKINELCTTFDIEDDEENAHDENGIGLKKTRFDYEASTLQRKKLHVWKKWRAEQ